MQERSPSINVIHTHRVPPHGPSHCSHRSGVSRHLCEAFVRHRLSKLHIPQKCVQHAAGERVYTTKQRTERKSERQQERAGKARVPHLIYQTETADESSARRGFYSPQINQCFHFKSKLGRVTAFSFTSQFFMCLRFSASPEVLSLTLPFFFPLLCNTH